MEVSPFDFSPGLIQSTDPYEQDTVVIVDGVAMDASQLDLGTQSRELEFKMEAKTENPEAALAYVGQIHKTRRLFTIKSLIWQNPLKEDAQTPEDADKIILTFNLGTNYYPTTPTVEGSAELVNKGKTQGDFIAQLSATTVYDDLILESVDVGKEDLFTMDGSIVKPAPKVNPTPAPVEDDSTVGSTDLNAPTTTPTGITQPVTF
jgi:hypothetical protein